MVNNESKYIKIDSILLSRISWELNKKEEYDFIICRWQMTFQASDHKERKFLDLNDDKGVYIHLTYTKERAWLKYFGLSNSICT